MPIAGGAKLRIAQCWSAGQRLIGHRPGLTILYYHAVADVDVITFDQHMAWLAANANVVFADHEGNLDPARPNVAVTFDDAFESVARNALPVLQRHGIVSTIFVPTGWVGRTPGWQMETDADRKERVMDANALREMPRDIVRFGSHTSTHPRLSQLAPDRRLNELRESRLVLEELFGERIDTLAFPYGDHDDATVNDARVAGYRFVYSILPKDVRSGHIGILRGRTSVDAADSMKLFRLKAEGAFVWLPAAIRAKRAIRGAFGQR